MACRRKPKFVFSACDELIEPFPRRQRVQAIRFVQQKELADRMPFPSSAGSAGMSNELIKFGKTVRRLGAPRVGVTPDPWKVQLQMARAEWGRRHPKT